MRILYVEDEETMRELIAHMIKDDIECDLVVVHSGNEAIKLLENDTNFDVIVSDYEMPDGNGGKLLEYVAQKGLSSYFILFTNTIEPKIEVRNEKFLGVISKLQYKNLFKQLKKILQ